MTIWWMLNLWISFYMISVRQIIIRSGASKQPFVGPAREYDIGNLDIKSI